MRLALSLLCLGALLFSAAVPTAHAQERESVSVRAILVSASREAGTTDRALARYEDTLRRILRFESFQQLGSGRARLSAPGSGSVRLGQGHELELQAESSKGDRVRVQVEWTANNRSLMRTGLVLRPGVPAVLGGPSRNDHEVYAVILIAD
ncbi:hypothetical protein [Actomonas aquatica]|uniref:Uncharacterized protein n=1 Tax=Actomonas aquatica TaxID=2866162 RepID=A0ABZ1C6S4_9BACT|nr:hypothetical protein [Opitutus sp. WL0086]WRQ87065.1 hypothetical protein K1X11_019800 [Opitutus sp. WL0086]